MKKEIFIFAVSMVFLLSLASARDEIKEPISPNSERVCLDKDCNKGKIITYSRDVFTREGGRYFGIGEVSSLGYDVRRDFFIFDYRGRGIWLKPFAVYDGLYKNSTQLRELGVIIATENSTNKFGHKFGINLIADRTTINHIDFFGFDIVKAKRVQNYSTGWIFDNNIKIDFTDWLESGFTIEFVNDRRILAGNISANYQNGMVNFDPSISLSGTAVTEDVSCGSSGCPVDFTYLDVDPLQSSPDRALLKFNTSELPSTYIVTEATLKLYQFVEALETGESFNASVYYMINDSWNETSLTNANQPCGQFFDNTSGCNLTAEDTINFSDGDVNIWRNFTVTNALNQDDNHSIGLVIKSTEDDTTSGGSDLVRFWSSEYTGDTSLIPHLEITYENTACEPNEVWTFPGWNYKREINITFLDNFANKDQKINITKEAEMQDDWEDIRFSDVGCNSAIQGQEMNFTFDQKEEEWAIIDIRFPSTTSGINSICNYYGNDSATSGENMFGTYSDEYEFVYHLNESNGLPNDSTINVRNGTCNNANCPTYNSTAIIGSGLEFEGINIGLAPFGEFNWINVSNTIGLLQSENEFTLEGWFMMASTTNDKGLITKWNGNGYMLFQHTSNEIRFYLSGTSIQSSGLEPNQIYYIVATWDNSGEFPVGNMSLYIDGVINVTGTDTSMGSNTLPLVLGTYNNRKQSVFNGTMDEIKVSNVARNKEWINQTHQSWIYHDEYITIGSGGNTFPKWKIATNSTNSTEAGEYIQHYVCLTDDTLKTTTFSFDNGNGTFYNLSTEDVTGDSIWANNTELVNSTVGTTIQWIFYFNDSIGQMNNTDTFMYITTGTAPTMCWIVESGRILIPPTCRYEVNTNQAYS